jgi:hypothetical protein
MSSASPFGDGGQQIAVRWVAAFEGFPGRRFNPFAVDQHPLELAIGIAVARGGEGLWHCHG